MKVGIRGSGCPRVYLPAAFPTQPCRLLGVIALGRNQCEFLSEIIWDVLACGSVQGGVCWCNCLIFLDLGAIKIHIACVSLGRRRKNLAFPWSGIIVF